MEIKPLGTEVQILILKKAEDFLRYDNHRWGIIEFGITGLCNQTQKAFKYYNMEIPSIPTIKEYIPLFTYENACKYSENTITGDYWWPRNDYINRLAFLDWMISELEKQLKD